MAEFWTKRSSLQTFKVLRLFGDCSPWTFSLFSYAKCWQPPSPILRSGLQTVAITHFGVVKFFPLSLALIWFLVFITYAHLYLSQHLSMCVMSKFGYIAAFWNSREQTKSLLQRSMGIQNMTVIRGESCGREKKRWDDKWAFQICFVITKFVC